MESDDVREFYDRFHDTRMLRYRRRRNLRIERATQRVLAHVRANSRVLEIGCGIGLVTEQIAKRAVNGKVWACDISPKNVGYASGTVRAANAHFFTCDVLREFEVIRSRIRSPLDVIVLIDVLEHLPLQSLDELFRNMRSISGEKATVVVTYPSPAYQQLLLDTAPDELQVIDETIPFETLHRVASTHDFHLKLYSLEDIWLRNQYVHCVFVTDLSVDQMAQPRGGIRSRLREVIDSVIPVSLRRNLVSGRSGAPGSVRPKQ